MHCRPPAGPIRMENKHNWVIANGNGGEMEITTELRWLLIKKGLLLQPLKVINNANQGQTWRGVFQYRRLTLRLSMGV